MHPSFLPPVLDMTSPIEYFPYYNGRYLAVAASLSGGNVLAAFVKMLQQWTHELGKRRTSFPSRTCLERPPSLAIKIWSLNGGGHWGYVQLQIGIWDQFFCQEYVVLQDRWFLKALVSQYAFHPTVEPILRGHCHERPPVFKDQIFLAEGATFQCNWTSYQRPPVLRDHIFMYNGVVFQDSFYCSTVNATATSAPFTAAQLHSIAWKHFYF